MGIGWTLPGAETADRARNAAQARTRRTICDPGALLLMELDGRIDAGRAVSAHSSAKAGCAAAAEARRVDKRVSIVAFKKSRL